MPVETKPSANKTFQVKVGYSKDNRNLTFRNPSSVAEMASHCETNGHIWLVDRNGQARQVKINGRVRRWKRDANRIEVPFKYGLYEYGTLEARDIELVLIEVPTEV